MTYDKELYTGQVAFVTVGMPDVWVFDSPEEAEESIHGPLGDIGMDGRQLFITDHGVGSFHPVLKHSVTAEKLKKARRVEDV